MEEKDYKKFLDPDFPILVEFRKIAPGSFKHCKNVASFCEAIAFEMDLNVGKMSVAGMYHDIGKMNYPDAFSENQNGSGNIHENFDPIISYHIITRHVGDSVLHMLNIDDMDRCIIDIVAQHHGNTVLRYFYEKSGSQVDDLYRYKTKPPTSIEAAILMISDSVEASARALYNNNELNTLQDKKDIVNRTTQRLIDDDQLDNIKVGELKVIRRVLTKELENTYHKRELYGDEKDSEILVKKSKKEE